MQLAKAAGAHVIATASADTKDRVQAHGADEVVDYTAVDVSAWVSEPVDVLLNLAPIDPEQFTALAARVRDGGVVVNTTVWMPAPSDEERGVRGIDLYVRSDATELAELSRPRDRHQAVAGRRRGRLIRTLGSEYRLSGSGFERCPASVGSGDGSRRRSSTRRRSRVARRSPTPRRRRG